MKIVRGKDLEFIPASHEDPKDPGVMKKVLLKAQDLISGQVQMINWAKLFPEKSFKDHYHEDMEEIFIIISGKAKIIIDQEEEVLEAGDAVLIPIGAHHQMINLFDGETDYIALGISLGKNGKTVNVN